MIRSPFPSLSNASFAKLLKWCLMVVALFWTLVFQLGEASGLPEFVYVNF